MAKRKPSSNAAAAIATLGAVNIFIGLAYQIATIPEAASQQNPIDGTYKLRSANPFTHIHPAFKASASVATIHKTGKTSRRFRFQRIKHRIPIAKVHATPNKKEGSRGLTVA